MTCFGVTNEKRLLRECQSLDSKENQVTKNSTRYWHPQYNLPPSLALFVGYQPIRVVSTIQCWLTSANEDFVAEQAGFSIVYPRTWVAVETRKGSHGDKEIVASISRFGRSFPLVSIARHQFQEDDGIYDVVEWGRNRAKREPSYIFISQEELDSQNYQGVLVEYTWENVTLTGSYVRHCEDWYVLVDSMGYALSFCIEEKDWQIAQETFKDMIQSFTVL